MTRNDVVVLIPVYKDKLSYYEQISVKQCARILSNYSIRLVTHNGVDLQETVNLFEEETKEIQIETFAKNYFQDISGYNRLLMSTEFFERFLEYEYLLIHQIDCFVFKDELLEWCRKKYSYIGAPWFEGYEYARSGSQIIGVGNGGLSLRNVNSHRKVLKLYPITGGPIRAIKNAYKENSLLSLTHIRNLPKKLVTKTKPTDVWYSNEDAFWSYEAKRYFPWFRIPKWQEAARFSLEVHPSYLLMQNIDELPFGCHGWWKYDFEFWRGIIRHYGYDV
jgi:hypothetical protein